MSGARQTEVALPSYVEPSEIATRSSLVGDLARLGVGEGDVLMAHVALTSLALVVGGARTVLDALYDALGPNGTLMMPAFSGELTDPATWFKPPVPESWWQHIRDEMPAFDPARTPTSGVGVVAELFRNEPDALRSPHPVSSFTARGPRADSLVAEHPLDQRFGPGSPLGRLCDLGGKVALIGAPYESLTLFHLTHYLVDGGETVRQSSPILVKGRKRWVRYDDQTFTWKWFPDAARYVIDVGIGAAGRVGAARAMLMPAAEAVEAVAAWRQTNAD